MCTHLNIYCRGAHAIYNVLLDQTFGLLALVCNPGFDCADTSSPTTEAPRAT